MEYIYTKKDLAEKSGKTEQSIHSFIKKNQTFMNQHSQRNGRFIKFDKAALEMVLKYYGVPAEGSEEPEQPEKAPEQPQKVLDPVQPSAEAQETKEAPSAAKEELEQKIKDLEARITDLTAQLHKSEDERQEMIKQNGALLLLLQEEKQEKQRLLPAPQGEKSGFWHNLFSRKKKD